MIDIEVFEDIKYNRLLVMIHLRSRWFCSKTFLKFTNFNFLNVRLNVVFYNTRLLSIIDYYSLRGNMKYVEFLAKYVVQDRKISGLTSRFNL